MPPVEQIAKRHHAACAGKRRGAVHRLHYGKSYDFYDAGHRQPMPYFSVYPLTQADILEALGRALTDERGFAGQAIEFESGVLEYWANVANGDARTALNALELAVTTTPPDAQGLVYISKETAQDSIQQRMLNIDDEHFYNMLSAFCKSLRGSDADAALAWFARMIYAGVDPRIIARRLIVHASEDVGMANPQAMVQAVAAAQALEFIGMPEARLNLAQAIIYICESPKSNSVLMGIEGALAGIQGNVEEPVPLHLRDTQLRRALCGFGSGKGYQVTSHTTIPAITCQAGLYRPRSVEHEAIPHYLTPALKRRHLELRKERRAAPPFAYIEVRP